MRRKLFNIALSPYFLALLVSVIVIALIPYRFNSYQASLIKSNYSAASENQLISYADLDGNQYDEQIDFKTNLEGNAAIVIRDHELKTIGQFNLNGDYPGGTHFFSFHDCDHDDFNEVYVLIVRNDSVFLSFSELVDLKKVDFQEIYIDQLLKNSSLNDYNIGIQHIDDLDSDGVDEVLFRIRGGFSLQPRNIYAFNPVDKSLLKSPLSYSYMSVRSIADIDGDGFKEILTGTQSTGNATEDYYPFDDSSAWLFVLDHKLEFKCPPKEFPGKQLRLMSIDFGKGKIATIIKNKGQNKQYPNLQVRFYAKDCRLMDSLILDYLVPVYTREFVIDKLNEDLFLLNKGTNSIYLINKNLKTRKVRSKAKISSGHRYLKDIDLDGLDELIIWSTEKNDMLIYRDKLQHPVFIHIPGNYFGDVRLISPRQAGEETQLFVQNGRNTYLFSYGKNPMYYLKYPYYALIYLIILGFILLVRKLQHIQFERKKRISDQISDLQLKTVKTRFDPHFTFNAINAIGYAIYKEDKNLAYDYVARLSDFMRDMMQDSDKIERSLREELNSVKNYLEIEKLRFKHKLDYEVQSDGHDVLIPKNLIFTFVENAVKHGIRPKEGEGCIGIQIIPHDKYATIIIEDDGIGRAEAEKQKTTGTGSGLKMVDQILELYKNLKGKTITYKISDKVPSGTAIEIEVPF
ncbi:MAG: histidine kinase [Bacteroidales bacterium]|nr:histidine kinase [Bacteroidales bacterium]MCF8343787.1 histidine kinase [Bacteroidales bacterium]MCF8350289.1 histidine kinase [Bacteroidales bacterium]MCF8374728.1 histidine kinase [Bacteroidales bacterium]MCF8399868.1 histidine kinase [Bacteroidales bacterium]